MNASLNNTLQVELAQLYELNKRHLIELMFFDDEVKFLRFLLEKYFKEDLQSAYFNKIKPIEGKLAQLSLVRNNIDTDALHHQGNLEAHLKGIAKHNSYFYEIESIRITQELHDLEHQFRRVKGEIFQLAKVILNQSNIKFNIPFS